MNKALFVLGVLFFVAAIVASVYTTTTTVQNEGFLGIGASTTTSTNAPYASYAMPIGGIGLILVIVGLAVKE